MSIAQSVPLFSDADHARHGVLSTRAEPASFGHASPAPLAVLVVEDDPEMAASLVGRLLDAGHFIVGPAPNAAMGELLAGQVAIDVALIDTSTTGIGGAADLARGLMSRWPLRSVLLIGYDEGALRDLGGEATLVRVDAPGDLERALDDVR